MTLISVAKTTLGALAFGAFVLAIVASGLLAAASLAGIVTWY